MRVITYRDALREAIREEMLRDQRVYILGEDIAGYGGTYSVTKGLIEEFGEKRVRDTPLAEEIIAGTAIGSALVGLRPICEIMTMNFSLLASDQIVNSAAKFHYMFGGQTHVPVVFRMPGGGGAQRGAQHSQFFESWYAHVPGLKVVMPGTPYDAKGMLKAAIRDDDPVVFVEHELLYNVKGEVPDEGVEYTIPLNRGEIKRQGRDVTIVTFSRMVHISLQAAEELAKEGIEAEVLDLRSIRPVDLDLITRVRPQDEPRGDRRGGLEVLRHRPGHRRADLRARLRLPRRAHRPRHGQGRADALLEAAGAGRAAGPRRCDRGSEGGRSVGRSRALGVEAEERSHAHGGHAQDGRHHGRGQDHHLAQA